MTHGGACLRRLPRIAAVLSLLALGACSRAVFDPAGDIAREQRDIILFSTALMLLIIVPVIVLIVVFAWRYRQGRGGTYDPSFHHSTPLELAIWSAPLLIIIALGALTWSSTHLLDPFRRISVPAKAGAGGDAAPLVIQVVSLDWKWLFIYPAQGVATVNELVLPVDREVRFDITSSNMMNTFYSPTLAGMVYAMPGMESQLHAVLRRTGEFDGYSANYSGAGFSDMHFVLKGVDDAGFARWLAQTKSAGGDLALTNLKTLLQPSERVPITRYAHVDGDVYRRLLERCVDATSRCLSDVMRQDMAPGHLMPPTHESEPANATPGRAAAPDTGTSRPQGPKEAPPAGAPPEQHDGHE